MAKKEMHGRHERERGLFKASVEPEEKAGRLSVLPAEEQRAERRGKRKSHHAGDDNGNGDGHGELPIHDARQTAQKAHRDEHRTENEHDGDDGVCHFPHGGGNSAGHRDVFRPKYALHVLKNDYGIVHDHTDGEHQSEKRQRIDGEIKEPYARKSPHQRNGNRNAGDKRSAPVLQKEVDHGKDKKHGLEKRAYHFFHGKAHENRCIVGHEIAYTRREKPGLFLHILFHALCGIESIASRSKKYGQWYSRRAVYSTGEIVAFGPQLHTRYVAQAQSPSFGRSPEYDVLELFSRDEPALSLQLPCHGQTVRTGLSAYASQRILRVLRLHGPGHIAGRHAELSHAKRVKP